jgi:glycosyltransferase involved in cell wall biosynthesis
MIFSIIIPIYKTEKYLNDCVQSVLSQSFSDYECILVDDGSPDNCPSLCDDFSKKNNHVKVIHKENGGLSDARNTGVLQATGKYIIFLDSDDKLADNDTLKYLFDVIQKYNTDVIINANLIEFNDNGKTTIKNGFDKDILLAAPNVIINEFNKPGMYLAGCFIVLKKEYIKNNNLFFKKGILHEDEHWMPRVLFRTKEIAVNHYPFYAYRVERDGSIMSKVSSKRLFDLLDTINDILAWSKEEENYTKEGCAFMLDRAKIIYDRVYELNNSIKFQDKKNYHSICKKLNAVFNKLPNDYTKKRLLITKIIGAYNTEILYKSYIKLKNKNA